MKNGKTKVYYSGDKGYIIGALTQVEGTGFHVIMEPVIVEDKNISMENLGVQIRHSLERSRNALPVDKQRYKDYKFWQISGYKGFASFSRHFGCMTILEEGDLLKVITLEREVNGAYSYPENKEPAQWKINISNRELGSRIVEMFSLKESNKGKKFTEFETLNGAKVSYFIPTEIFFDAGDGHTDAYQIYHYELNADTYFAFLIDNGYRRIDESGIWERWKELYGSIEQYCFEKTKNSFISIVASASIKDQLIKSYFLENGNGFLEVSVHISKKIMPEEKILIEREIERIVHSIQIH